MQLLKGQPKLASASHSRVSSIDITSILLGKSLVIALSDDPHDLFFPILFFFLDRLKNLLLGETDDLFFTRFARPDIVFWVKVIEIKVTLCAYHGVFSFIYRNFYYYSL